MKIPARYIGAYAVTLKDGTGALDGEGKPLTTGLIEYGTTLMMNEEEVLGQTFLADRATGVLRSLGAGRVILPEHEDASDDELAVYGYQFHGGRTDFEPVTPPTIAEESIVAENILPLEDTLTESRKTRSKKEE